MSKVPNINFYSNFAPDYPHAVCLGVTRKLFHVYFNKRVKQSTITEMSDEICELAKYTPKEFQRRPRRIDKELSHFKATEFRLFLLYVGPYLFKKYLPTRLYNHFMLLHFAIYVLSSEEFFTSLFEQANSCLKVFVSQTEDIFGELLLTYNMHVLLHIPEFVKQHGTLNNFSTFEFENYLSRLKLHIRRTRYVSTHVINQAANLRSYKFTSPETDLLYSNAYPNNCAFIENCLSPILIASVDRKNNSVSGYTLKFKKCLYTYPYSSELLRIGYYCKTLVVKSGTPVKKCYILPYGNEYLLIPFC